MSKRVPSTFMRSVSNLSFQKNADATATTMKINTTSSVVFVVSRADLFTLKVCLRRVSYFCISNTALDQDDGGEGRRVSA
jgi:hypothetical protein